MKCLLNSANCRLSYQRSDQSDAIYYCRAKHPNIRTIRCSYVYFSDQTFVFHYQRLFDSEMSEHSKVHRPMLYHSYWCKRSISCTHAQKVQKLLSFAATTTHLMTRPQQTIWLVRFWPDHYFSRHKQNSILQKASNKQKCQGDFWAKVFYATQDVLSCKN